jgi:hypothetical protein
MKTVRKSKARKAKKAVRKSTGKARRKTARKAVTKARRRNVRKPAAKSVRRAARKSAVKTSRKAAAKRKPIRASRGKRPPKRSTRPAKSRSGAPASKSKRVAGGVRENAAASLAASVLSRRALAAPTRAKEAAAAKTVALANVREPRIRRKQPSRQGRGAGTVYRTNREVVRVNRAPQYAYMKAPGASSGFDVGDPVEVLCDHEKNSERVRGWIRGVVVQVDNKLVAVQFRSNVFLTDGWMVPDRILWYAVSSDQIRSLAAGKKAAQKALPEY